MVHPEPERPEITGGVLSILIVIETVPDNPAPFVAEQVKVTPAVSVVRVVCAQPVEDAIPDSGSLTFQTTVTLLLYQPLLPKVPVITGTTTGGVVSITNCHKTAMYLAGDARTVAASSVGNLHQAASR